MQNCRLYESGMSQATRNIYIQVVAVEVSFEKKPIICSDYVLHLQLCLAHRSQHFVGLADYIVVDISRNNIYGKTNNK